MPLPPFSKARSQSSLASQSTISVFSEIDGADIDSSELFTHFIPIDDSTSPCLTEISTPLCPVTISSAPCPDASSTPPCPATISTPTSDSNLAEAPPEASECNGDDNRYDNF